MKRIAVLVSGGGSNLQSLIDKVHNIYGEIALVISNKKDAYGLVRAQKANIESVYISGKDPDYHKMVMDLLEAKSIDLIVLAGYLKIVPAEMVQKFRNRIINVHPSLIPAFCGDGCYGIKVHEKALEYGVKVSGATVHFVDEGTDSGHVIMQKCVNVDGDSPKSLQMKVLEIEHEILPKAVKEHCLGNIQVEGRKVRIK